MTDDELKHLNDLPTPPPRPEARAAALAAALAAFEHAGAEVAGKNPGEEPQGKEGTPRLMHASDSKRRQEMRAPMTYKIAAGIAVVLVATPASLYFTHNGSFYAPEPSVADQERATTEQQRKQDPAKPALADGDSTRLPASAPARPAQGQNFAAPPPPPAAQDRLSKEERDAPADSKIAAAPEPAPQPQQGAEANVASRAGDEKTGEAFSNLQLGKPKAARPQPGGGSLALSGKVMMAPSASDRAAPAAPYAAPMLMQRDDDQRVMPPPEENRNQFETTTPNPVKQVATDPVSTFSIDVDTASYAYVRRALNTGHLPPKDAVRVEEMINYFPYDYPRPESADTPFQSTVTVMPAPWRPTDKLVHIGVRGYDVVPAERPRANLVFLIDISGSMQPEDRLPLVKNAFRLLLDELRPDDTVGIVTYASGSGIALEPTKLSEKGKILAAIEALGAGGSTAGAAGINDAYRLAEAHFDKNGVNRIILATDGDFNVGISNRDELKGFIERKRASGIFLSILGVGEGNYNDAMMQALAQNGNGTAAYVDTLNEARKVLVDEASSTLFTIAKDVKIQVEFNPATVSEYRLIGYETRALAREDFNNDKVDAGDIGSGHTVTAIYEVTPVGAPKLVDNLRYSQQPAAPAPAGQGGELGFLKLRYKLPKEEVSKLISLPITPALEKPDVAAAPEDVRFSVGVAAFGQLLRGLPFLGSYGYDDVLTLAQTARGNDPYGYRAEFLNLVRLAKSARP